MSHLHLPARWLTACETRARRAHPREACGLLLGVRFPEGLRVLAACSAANRHPCPERAFELDPGRLVRAALHARRRGLELLGTWHSHPDAPPRASAGDLEGAWPGHVLLILSSWRCAGGIRPGGVRGYLKGARGALERLTVSS